MEINSLVQTVLRVNKEMGTWRFQTVSACGIYLETWCMYSFRNWNLLNRHVKIDINLKWLWTLFSQKRITRNAFIAIRTFYNFIFKSNNELRASPIESWYIIKPDLNLYIKVKFFIGKLSVNLVVHHYLSAWNSILITDIHNNVNRYKIEQANCHVNNYVKNAIFLQMVRISLTDEQIWWTE